MHTTPTPAKVFKSIQPWKLLKHLCSRTHIQLQIHTQWYPKFLIKL